MTLGTLTYTVGLPGSGKSTWALAQIRRINGAGGKAARVNRDALRWQLFGLRWAPGVPMLSREQEDIVTLLQKTETTRLLINGWNVFNDDTNLRPDQRQAVLDTAHDLGAEIITKSFQDVPLETCISRDAGRGFLGHPWVGEDVIRSLHERYLSEVPC